MRPKDQKAGAYDSNGELVEGSLLCRCRDGRASTRFEPTTPDPTPVRLPDTYLFGGYLSGHFGHFLLESLARFWATQQYPELPIIWQRIWPEIWPEMSTHLKHWQTDILKMLQIKNELILPDSDVEVERLVIPTPGYVMWDHFHQFHEKFLAVNDFGPIVPGKKIWLSRSELYGAGGFTNEKEIESELKKAGWIVFAPEKHTLATQVERLKGAERIAGVEGSAFHTLVLLKNVCARIDIFARQQEIATNGVSGNYLRIASTKDLNQTVHFPKLSYISGEVTHRRYAVDDITTVTSVLSSRIQSGNSDFQGSTSMDAHTMKNAIAIIGIAGFFPGSRTIRQFYDNALRSRCFVRDIPEWLWEKELFFDENHDKPLASYSQLAGLLDDLNLDVSRFRIPPHVAAYMSRNQKLALLCTEEALKDAGYLTKEFNRERTGVVIGAWAGETQEQYFEATLSRRLRSRLTQLAGSDDEKKILKDLWDRHDEEFIVPITEDTLPGFNASLVAGRIVSAFDLHGPNLTIDSACASTLAAVANSVNLLRTGVCDMVITGGVETDVSAGSFIGFSKIGALSANGSFPFDRRADGFVMGEGCGVFILKRYEDALRDNDQIHALIRGWGSSSDGAGKGITAPSKDGQLRALQRAYEDAGLSPDKLSFVECHGTGTRVGDVTELQALGEFISEYRETPLPIGSAKAMTGHLKVAAGAVGLFRGLLAVNSRVIPPQVNYNLPNDTPDWQQLRLRVPVTPEAIAVDEVVVGVSAFGFGGSNFHMVLSTPPDHARQPLLSAQEYLHPQPPRPANDTAFLFPGQGSHYAGMLDSFRNIPAAVPLFDAADLITREITGSPITDDLFPKTGCRSPEDVQSLQSLALQRPSITQPAIFLTSAIMLKLVQRSGIQCGMAIGHSLGEFTALYAAGYLSFEDAFRLVTIRGQLTETLTPENSGSMAVIHSGESEVRTLLEEVEGYLACANLNSYQQTVISGDTDAINRLIEKAMSVGIQAYTLNVSRAFHSAHMLPVQAPLRSALETLVIHSPGSIATSHQRGVIYPCPPSAGAALENSARSQVIDLLSQQAVNPVDFISQIELAYQSGIRRFVEIGPRNVLTGLVDDILQGKQFQTIYLDHGKKTLEQLQELSEVITQAVKFQRRPLPLLPRSLKSKGKTVSTEYPETMNRADTVRRIIATVTGYPEYEIHDEAEFESDLGIDTLKIFDIISRLRGTVLATTFRDFRRATSINKILGLAETAEPVSESNTRTVNEVITSQELSCYRLGTAKSQADTPVHDISYRLIMPNSSPGNQRCEHTDDVLLLWPLPQSAADLVERTIPELLRSVLKLAAEQRQHHRATGLHIVSHAEQDQFSSASYLALCALVKSFQLDLPKTRFCYCHLDAAVPTAGQLSRALACRRIGEHLLTDGSVEVPSLSPMTVPQLPSTGEMASMPGHADLILVTGGARGITSRIVRYLLEHTSARFLLIGRKEQPEPWISAQGKGRVEYFQADLANPDAVRQLDLGNRPVTLLVHAAGVVFSRSPDKATSDELTAVLGAKVLALQYLLENLDQSRLRGIINFSSTAGFFGAPGNFDYAAANGYLNGFTAKNIPVLNLGWSAWDELGMASDGITREFMRSAGIGLIPVRQGVDMFMRLLDDFLGRPASGATSIVVHAGMAEGCFLDSDPLQHDMVQKNNEDTINKDLGFQITTLRGPFFG